MATINGSTSSNLWTYKLEAYETSYSIENNTSNVRVDVYLGRASSRSYLGGIWDGSVTVDGSSQSISGTIPYPTYIDGGGWLLLATRDFTVGHNSDGSKITNVSSSFSSSDFVPNSASASGNLTLTTIPRASSISCSGGNIASATIININRYSSSFVHTITYSFGSLRGTIVTKTSSTSIGWRIPNSFYAQIPNSNSGIVTLTCYTYNGNTLIGTNTITCEVRVTNSNPIFENSQLTYLDSNSSIVAITENNQHIVRNNSYLRITYTAATAQNSATISSYEIAFNGTIYNQTAAGTFDIGLVNLSNDATISIKAIDSRGNSTTISKTITILDWVNPSATLTYGRVNNYEDETKLKVSAIISSVNSKNVIQSISYRYKKLSDTNYSGYIAIANYMQVTLYIDKMYAWNFQVVITDKFGNTTYNFVIAKGVPIAFFDVNKLSVGINCFPKNSNDLALNEYSLSNTYSTDEVQVGVWIDGRALYRKVVYISSLPNSSLASYSTNISYMKYLVNLYGIATNNSVFFPINTVRVDNSSAAIGCYYENGNLKISTGADRTGYSAYVILEYTKQSEINFNINSTTYTAIENMTWGEWIDSEYNTLGLTIDNFYGSSDYFVGKQYTSSIACIDETHGSTVAEVEVIQIIENHNYILARG